MQSPSAWCNGQLITAVVQNSKFELQRTSKSIQRSAKTPFFYCIILKWSTNNFCSSFIYTLSINLFLLPCHSFSHPFLARSLHLLSSVDDHARTLVALQVELVNGTLLTFDQSTARFYCGQMDAVSTKMLFSQWNTAHQDWTQFFCSVLWWVVRNLL